MAPRGFLAGLDGPGAPRKSAVASRPDSFRGFGLEDFFRLPFINAVGEFDSPTTDARARIAHKKILLERLGAALVRGRRSFPSRLQMAHALGAGDRRRKSSRGAGPA